MMHATHGPLCPSPPPRRQADYSGLYSSSNVLLSATHTHESAGGFLQYFLYHATSLGIVQQNLNALVEGILQVCALYVGFRVCALYVGFKVCALYVGFRVCALYARFRVPVF